MASTVRRACALTAVAALVAVALVAPPARAEHHTYLLPYYGGDIPWTCGYFAGGTCVQVFDGDTTASVEIFDASGSPIGATWRHWVETCVDRTGCWRVDLAGGEFCNSISGIPRAYPRPEVPGEPKRWFFEVRYSTLVTVRLCDAPAVPTFGWTLIRFDH